MALRTSTLVAATSLLFAIAGCDSRRYDQAVSVLIDVSGTYADEKTKTVDIIKRQILPHLVPGDTLLVIRIDSESYERENAETLLTLDRRPSRANAQKLAAANSLEAFAQRAGSSRHTDIPGALMLASEYLAEIGADSSAILLFSDMEEDLPSGSSRVLEEGELDSVHVVAINVKRLDRDTANPRRFRARMAKWKKRLRAAGAEEWRTLMNPEKLPDLLAGLRT